MKTLRASHHIRSCYADKGRDGCVPAEPAAQQDSSHSPANMPEQHPTPANQATGLETAGAGAASGEGPPSTVRADTQEDERGAAQEGAREGAGVSEQQHPRLYGDLPDKPGHLSTVQQCRMANGGVCWHLLQMAVRARQIAQKSDDANVSTHCSCETWSNSNDAHVSTHHITSHHITSHHTTSHHITAQLTLGSVHSSCQDPSDICACVWL